MSPMPLPRKQWNLHTIAGIAVKCLDVWDYERVTTAPAGVRGLEDQFSDTYKHLENKRLDYSYHYNEWAHGGYQNVDVERPEIRHPDIEMSVVRFARRKMNAQRRNLHAHLGQSVHSLDPSFVPPTLDPQSLAWLLMDLARI